MKYNIYHATKRRNYDLQFVGALIEGITKNNLEYECFDKDKFRLAQGRAWHHDSGLRRCLVVELGSKFCIISHEDYHGTHKKFSTSKYCKINLIEHEDCMGVLQCQYRHEEGDSPKIQPYMYLEQDRPQYLKIKKDLVYAPKHKTLHYRGNIQGCDNRRPRRYIIPLIKDIITDGHENVKAYTCPPWSEEKASRQNPLYMEAISMEEYMKELNESYLALCLPGNGNFCHRELECFGLGVPVLMPKLINSYFDPLIPDYHYISIDISFQENTPQEVADAIRKKYHEVIDNTDLLEKVRINALAWYSKNADNAFKIIKNLLSQP